MVTASYNDEYVALHHFLLHFEETNEKAGTVYTVDFWPGKLSHNDTKRAVLEGEISLCGYTQFTGKIEYNKETGVFRRVSFSPGTTRTRGLMGNLKLKSPQAVVDDLVDFFNQCEVTQPII